MFSLSLYTYIDNILDFVCCYTRLLLEDVLLYFMCMTVSDYLSVCLWKKWFLDWLMTVSILEDLEHSLLSEKFSSGFVVKANAKSMYRISDAYRELDILNEWVFVNSPVACSSWSNSSILVLLLWQNRMKIHSNITSFKINLLSTNAENDCCFAP